MGSSSLLESPLLSPPTAPRKLLEEGCTVDGGLTGQRFIEEDFTPEKNFIVMKLVLRGFNANDDKVESATKPTHCTHCGQKKGRKADRFCGKCGYKI